MSIGKALKDFRLGKSSAKTRKEAVAQAKTKGLTAGDAASALARAKGAGNESGGQGSTGTA
jgi:hypothetical protein